MMKQFKTKDTSQMKAYMATYKGVKDDRAVPFQTLSDLLHVVKG